MDKYGEFMKFYQEKLSIDGPCEFSIGNQKYFLILSHILASNLFENIIGDFALIFY